MISKFDELFSTEKLNQNWQAKGLVDKELLVIEKNKVIHIKFEKLQQLLVEKYGDISCLSVKISELTEIIAHHYPLNNSMCYKFFFVHRYHYQILSDYKILMSHPLL